jgi:hypothetical protein
MDSLARSHARADRLQLILQEFVNILLFALVIEAKLRALRYEAFIWWLIIMEFPSLKNSQHNYAP